MECYHYVNIFETKGLEYLLVVVFLLALMFLVKQLRTARQIPRQVPPEQPPSHNGRRGSAPRRSAARTGSTGPRAG
jgi:hypothetical protein